MDHSYKGKFAFVLTFTVPIIDGTKKGDSTVEINIFTDNEDLMLSTLYECKESIKQRLNSEGHTVIGEIILINCTRFSIIE